ncbi:hypothetical protein GMES_1273 [Paraglaciecola mesophila KMM 241]|uniref:Uncharacterized protein n=1 Tax=Paraglaciecola mesophila KMM 241 TaxID=1128912 RepID=K6YZH6_9ALTE|nr:hypothetical protein GMES_1273 [Paraglaciecola mesophila KMM 241]
MRLNISKARPIYQQSKTNLLVIKRQHATVFAEQLVGVKLWLPPLK